jgi:ribosomal protein S12 methylthiotransferase accessory factor YcaO
MNILDVIRLYRALEPIAKPVVAELVRAIATHENPKNAAERALREVTHGQATEKLLDSMGKL